jgi:hypothetical protein
VQNRYVGDLGDFGKYALLNALTKPTESHPGFSLAVLWYLVPDEGHNEDGKYISYLTSGRGAALQLCDPDLYSQLQQIVRLGRSVARIASATVLPQARSFYAVPLCYHRPERLSERRAKRAVWLRGAMDAITDADVVFVDPDNGLQCGVSPYAKRGPKYAYHEDLKQFANGQRTLVIYHHIGRQASAFNQVRARAAELRRILISGYETLALLYHRGSARAYFMATPPTHSREIYSRSKHFMAGEWSRHFDFCDLGP